MKEEKTMQKEPSMKGDLVQRIHECVLEARKNKEWKAEYESMQIKLDEAYNEGIILGREEGIKEANTNFAKKLLSMNYDEKTIADLTGLKLSEIRKMK